MITYLSRKTGYSIFVLLGVLTLVFFLFHVLPADPARLTMGQRSDELSIQNAREELRLDQPVWKRYLLFLDDLSPISIIQQNKENKRKYTYQTLTPVKNDKILVLKFPYLGRSYTTKRPVSEVLLEALPGTVILALSALSIATILGICLGSLAALKKGSWIDTSSVAASVIGISTPSFFAGLLIAYIFGYLLHSWTGLSMTGSLWTYDPFEGRRLALENLILPAIALGIRPMAIVTQLTRSSLLDVLSQDYIRTGYAKGLSKKQVWFRHALPNALNPVVTAISGWFAELLAGSFFIEYIFGWKGIGKTTVDALNRFDYPVVMGSMLLTASLFILINFLTDFLYGWLDPRVRQTDRK